MQERLKNSLPTHGLVVAGEGLLVEDGGVAADEGPVGGLDDGAEVVLDGQADVEHL